MPGLAPRQNDGDVRRWFEVNWKKRFFWRRLFVDRARAVAQLCSFTRQIHAGR